MTLINLKKTKQNRLVAVSASIFIHLAIGLLLIQGILSDGHFTPALNKLNLAWVSLESGSVKTIDQPSEKRAEKKQFPTTATQADKINSIPTINAAKNISVQSYSVQEESSGKAASANAANNSTNFSNVSALPAAGNSSAFVSASPLYRENTPPIYPAIAKLRGYEGVVLVNAEILPDGRVGSTAISKSSGYTILDKSAMEAVKLWKFEPAKKAGKPFAVRVKLPIKFVLHDDNSAS
jgi:TonB family protein